MYRKTECLGCGYVQESFVSYYLERKQWKSIHTPDFCRSRQAHPAFLAKKLVK
jgi:hypothetical protein